MANGSGGVRTATEEKGDIHYQNILTGYQRFTTLCIYSASISRCSCLLTRYRLDPVLQLVCKEFGKFLEKQGNLISARKVYLVAKEEKRAMACQKKLEIRQEILDAKLLSNEREELSIQEPPSDCMSSEAVCLQEEDAVREEKKKNKNYFSNFEEIMKFGTGGRKE